MLNFEARKPMDEISADLASDEAMRISRQLAVAGTWREATTRENYVELKCEARPGGLPFAMDCMVRLADWDYYDKADGQLQYVLTIYGFVVDIILDKDVYVIRVWER